MMRLTFLSLAGALLLCGCVSQRDSEKQPHAKIARIVGLSSVDSTTQQAYQKLLSVKCFALGGIGFAGLTSPGESYFRVIISNTNRLQIFRKILTNGTVEAKLYALCGIRLGAPDEFDADAKPIITANKVVSEMQGCIGKETGASNIVVRIKSGWYDSFLARDR